MKKCKDCGRQLSKIDTRKTIYEPLEKRYRRGFHMCGRMVMKLDRDWSILLSVHDADDFSKGSNTPRPICAECFLKKLRRAVVAIEIALEGRKSIDPENEEPQEAAPIAQPQEPAEDRSFEDAVWAAFDK